MVSSVGQLTSKIILPKISIPNRSAVLAIQKDKILNSPAPTLSTLALGNHALTLSPAEDTPLHDPAPSASILCSALMALTPPNPSHSDFSSYSPGPVGPSTPTYSLPRSEHSKFWPGDRKCSSLSSMAQSTYPPPAATPEDDLASTSKSTARELHHAPSFLAFLAFK